MNTYDYRGISQLPNYELNVISQHDQFKGKQFKKHHVQAIDTIGASGFPADQARGVNLKNTPRIGKIDRQPAQQAVARF